MKYYFLKIKAVESALTNKCIDSLYVSYKVLFESFSFKWFTYCWVGDSQNHILVHAFQRNTHQFHQSLQTQTLPLPCTGKSLAFHHCHKTWNIKHKFETNSNRKSFLLIIYRLYLKNMKNASS